MFRYRRSSKSTQFVEPSSQSEHWGLFPEGVNAIQAKCTDCHSWGFMKLGGSRQERIERIADGTPQEGAKLVSNSKEYHY